MDRDRGRDRRFVPLRLPQYRDLDMDVLNYDDEDGEDGEVIVEVEKPAREFRIRGFSERIAKDLGMAGLPLQNDAFKELALKEMVSFDEANAVEPYEGSEGGRVFTAMATLTRGDGGLTRISESEEDGSMRSATTLHGTISKTDTIFADRQGKPSHAINQVDFDLTSLLSHRRQQALHVLQVNHNGGHPDHQLTNPNRYVRGDGEVTKMGAGESYRPSARPRSPRSDTSRFDRDRSPRRDRPRSPIRDRARSPPFGADTYNPGGRDRSPLRSPIRYRSRERTPLRDAPTWRDRPRPRSPARIRSPMRARSPIRQRSPMRARSPMRPRSPVRTRSPPRRFSPRRVDDRRPRSPRRSDLDERDIR